MELLEALSLEVDNLELVTAHITIGELFREESGGVERLVDVSDDMDGESGADGLRDKVDGVSL